MNNNAGLLTFWLGQYLAQMPVVLAIIVGFLVVLTKRSQAPAAATWALLGFGLALLVAIAMPIAQTVAQRWMIESGETAAHIGYVFTGLALFWSVLHAAVYILLLVAVFAGRPSSQPGSPPPLPRAANPNLL